MKNIIKFAFDSPFSTILRCPNKYYNITLSNWQINIVLSNP